MHKDCCWLVGGWLSEYQSSGEVLCTCSYGRVEEEENVDFSKRAVSACICAMLVGSLRFFLSSAPPVSRCECFKVLEKCAGKL